MNIDYCGHTFLHRSLLYSSSSAAPHCSTKKPIPTDGNTSAKNMIFRPIQPNDRTTKDWTAMAWPTNIQSGTPDGRFGPAKQMVGWGDCWFLAPLSAVANNPNGHKILTESIKRANGGYEVTFMGSSNKNVFISDAELQELLETEGGDADTRLMELAADKFFNESGNFKSLFIASMMSEGWDQEEAKQCLQSYCSSEGIQDQMAYNPIRNGGENFLAFVMLTGKLPDILTCSSTITLHDIDIMAYLNWYVVNDRDGISVTIQGIENPLGESKASRNIVLNWDVIRTEITRDKRFHTQKRAFFKALDKWLATGSPNDLQALKFAAGNLNLEHINLVKFVNKLVRNLFFLNPEHVKLLRSGVQEVLDGKPGYIGFIGNHAGNIEGMNKAAGTFTYSEPQYPTIVHTGKLPGLIQAIRSGRVCLTALRPTTKPDDRQKRVEQAGTGRGRRLRQIYHQVVRDGKIDQAESGLLADLMEIDAGTFRKVYDGDSNGVIEGGELKAVKLRVDRWVEQYELTPLF